MLAVPVCPSMLVAVTVYVNVPAVEVSSAPLPPEAPLESTHDWIPGAARGVRAREAGHDDLIQVVGLPVSRRADRHRRRPEHRVRDTRRAGLSVGAGGRHRVGVRPDGRGVERPRARSTVRIKTRTEPRTTRSLRTREARRHDLAQVVGLPVSRRADLTPTAEQQPCNGSSRCPSAHRCSSPSPCS